MKTKAQEGAEAPETGAETQSRPLRYVNTNFTIPGVPARDLTAEEAARYGARINEAQVNSAVTIYEEVS